MSTNDASDALRALWQKQPDTSFSMTPNDVRKKFAGLQRKLRRRMLLCYVICLVEVTFFARWLIFTNPPVAVRVSFLLIIFGLNFCAGQIWLDGRDRRRILEKASTSERATFAQVYRAQLVQQHNFHRGFWFWSRFVALFPGLWTISIWDIVAFPGKKPAIFGERMLCATIVIALGAVWRNYQESRKYQRQIDAIDEIPKTNNSQTSESE